jgi:hypothetical protein
MPTMTPIEILEQDEREAWTRLAAYRGRLHRHDVENHVVVERRLRELEQKWERSSERLHKALRDRQR